MTSIPADAELLEPQDDARWDSYVRGHERATLFHSTRWRQVVESALGHRGHYLFVREGERIAGILPLFQVGVPMLGRALVALPFAGTQPSVCADSPAAEARLVAAAGDLARTLGAPYVELREDAEKPWDCSLKQAYVNVRLPLSRDSGEVWQTRVESRVRTKVRAARKRGLTVRWAGAAGLGAFHGVYTDTMHRLGSPPHGRLLFETVLRLYPEESDIALVMDGEEPVAGAFVMHDETWFGFPWAASLTRARSKHPNNLLYWALIERACERGHDYLDLGRSPVESGTAHFKTQWGGVARPLSYYYKLTGARQPPARDAADPAMQLASSLWRRLPLPVSNMLGPSLARLIP